MTELDLTPQPSRPERGISSSVRNWLIMGLLAAVAGGVLYQALTTARVYFLNVDEAVAQRADLGERSFNLQGTVTSDSSAAADGAMLFVVSFGGVDVDVRHIGDEPTDLFVVGQPVVAKGRWSAEDPDVFVSDQILVVHSEEYVEDNPDRVEYDLDGTEIDVGLGATAAELQ